MKVVTDELNIGMFTSRSFEMYFGGRSFAVFDIETTGLSLASSSVMLSGILMPDGDRCQTWQFFAEGPEDEEAILMKTYEILDSVDYIVTFNGKHFDVPFIENRGRKYGLNWHFAGYDLDLYLLVNGQPQIKSVLPNLKQKTVEIFMGVGSERDDRINGGDSVDLYYRYLERPSASLVKTIMLHNHDDIVQLYRLMPIIAMCDLDRSMYRMGFQAGDYRITKIGFSGRDLVCEGFQTTSPVDYISFPSEERPYSLNMNSKSAAFKLIVPGECQSGAIYFDARAILGENSEIERYPSFADGYLIASDHGAVNHLEINAFLMEFFIRISDRI